ncbi:MAG: response regulator [Mariprofundaceae bacterium]
MFHIIDDEEFLRELLSGILEDEGYPSICFESGLHYLDYLHSSEFEKPVAILSDVTMPGINGYDLALEVRQHYPQIKIILITGNSDEAHHQRAAKHLCYSLDKPFQPQKLLSLLNILKQCNHAARDDGQNPYTEHCQFGLDHHCPFHEPAPK